MWIIFYRDDELQRQSLKTWYHPPFHLLMKSHDIPTMPMSQVTPHSTVTNSLYHCMYHRLEWAQNSWPRMTKQQVVNITDVNRFNINTTTFWIRRLAAWDMKKTWIQLEISLWKYSNVMIFEMNDYDLEDVKVRFCFVIMFDIFHFKW